MITTKETISFDQLSRLPHTEEGGIDLSDRGAGKPPFLSIAHKDLISTLIVEATGRGIRVEEPSIVLSPDQQDMTCSLTLFDPRISPELPTDCTLSIGATTSNAGRFSLQTYYGVTTIWGAGIPLGTLTEARQHVATLNLDAFAEEVLSNLATKGRRVPKLIERMKDTKLDTGELVNALVSAGEGRDRLIPLSWIGRVLKEIVRPCSGQTEWNTWNAIHAFAFVSRDSPALPAYTPGQMASVLGFLEMLPIKGGRQ